MPEHVRQRMHNYKLAAIKKNTMTHLNYFLPYNKSSENHEDHLTRAFLVVLKHSPTALSYFYDYVYEQITNMGFEDFNPLYSSPTLNVSFQTQTGSLPQASSYVSILLTNERVKLDTEIIPIKRNAIYDGVINFNEEVIFFIETKPNNSKVWQNQLRPSTKDIPEGSKLLNKAILVEWKEIINFLHKINSSNTCIPSEKIIINDFFEFVNSSFNYLNPYDDLSKCSTNYLVGKRIEQILREIAFEEDKVKYHSGWGYFIEVGFPEIKKLALLIDETKSQWLGLTVAVDFGSIVSQARSFYSNMASFEKLKTLENFTISCNFHLAVRSQNLIFLNSPENSEKEYFEYWKGDGYKKIAGVSKERLDRDYLQEFAKEGIIAYDLSEQIRVNQIILQKRYQRINICPAMYAKNCINKELAIKLDEEGKLIQYVKDKMLEVIAVLNKSSFNVIK